MDVLQILIPAAGLLIFPSGMLLLAFGRRDVLWAGSLGLGIAASVMLGLINDNRGIWIYGATLAASGVFYFSHRTSAGFRSSNGVSMLHERFHYLVVGAVIVIVALIYASLNRYAFLPDPATQRTRVYDRLTGKQIP